MLASLKASLICLFWFLLLACDFLPDFLPFLAASFCLVFMLVVLEFAVLVASTFILSLSFINTAKSFF